MAATGPQATGRMLGHDPAGDRDATTAGGGSVRRSSGLNVELDGVGHRALDIAI